MIDALRREKDPMERHRLLGEIVEASHRQRADAAMNKLFLRFAGMHVKELPKMAAALRAAGGGRRPAVPAFTLLAAALEEDGQIEEALSVCNQAAELGLTDGTQTGFAGRIRRLKKRMKDTQPRAKRPSPKAARIRGKGKG
jgi:imidazolonepropionase-like amidohydrolase